MFFSQDILQRRGGKFGIVWLAATKCTPVSLSRRDYCTVSISKTCDDILKYICLEGQPLKPHGARPRLSLYLSSQLMFGVTRVYRKQVEFLSVEVRDLYMRFASAKQILQATEEGTDLAKIRMQKTSGFCTLQDPLIDMRESDFGVMRFQDERAIDPSNLPYIDFVQDVGPLFPVIMTPEHTISPKLSRINEILHTAQTVTSASEISIKEISEPPTLLIPGDADLPALEEHIEEFMEQIQVAMGKFQDSQTEEPETETTDVEPVEVCSVVDGNKRTKVSDQAEIPSESPSKGPPPRELDLEKEAALHLESVTPTHPMQIPVLHLSPLHPSPVVPSSPIRHGHRRQLLFSDVVDDFTQLSKQYIRNNMATSSDLCHTFDEVLPAVPIQKAKELLELPGRTGLTKSKTLMDLWKSKLVAGKSISSDVLKVRRDKDSSTATEPSPLSSSPQVQDSKHEMTASPEQLRDISVESARPSRLEETPAALTFSDVSRLSESRDSTQPSSLQMEQSTLRHKRRLTEKSIEEEVTIPGDQMLIMDLPDEILPEHQIETLQDIPEVHKSPDIGASEEDQVISVPHPNVIREIAHLTAADETITFKDLVPVTTTCTDASKVFSVCLDYAALKLIKLWQTLAYGDICIRRGDLF